MKIRYIVLTLFILLLPTVWLADMNMVGATELTRHAVRSIDVLIPEASEGAFIDQLRKFSEKYRFDISIGHPTPDQRHIIIQMTKFQTMIVIANPFNTNNFSINFYDQNENGTLGADFDAIILHIESIIRELPGSRIPEDKENQS